MKLYDPSTIRMIRNQYKFRFSKNLGQNFLTNGSVLEDMADAAAVGPDDYVLEIGPGIGTLTSVLCERAGHVTAVEVDEELLPILDFTLAEYHNVNIISGDILKQDIQALLTDEKENWLRKDAPVKIMGNLPYYITTPILMAILKSRPEAESLTVMVQKEVAERIASGPGTKAYGALSVVVQYFCEAEIIRIVSKEDFMPAPKVDSAVLHMRFRKEPAVETKSEEWYFRTVRAAFQQRRKTLLNSLSGLGKPKPEIERCLNAAGIDPKRRAETLDLAEFARLADELAE